MWHRCRAMAELGRHPQPQLTMSSSAPEHPHLVSLVLQSKKALQHGQQICSLAHLRSNTSAKTAIDVLALDAKVRWMNEAVIEQLKVYINKLGYTKKLIVYYKLATSVAKSIEEKRAHLYRQVQVSR